MARHKFKVGDDVCLTTNPKIIMTVRRILKKQKDIFVIRDGEKVKEPKVFLIGIECRWFDKDGNMQKEKFHSHSLVPLDIAKEGTEAIDAWIAGVR